MSTISLKHRTTESLIKCEKRPIKAIENNDFKSKKRSNKCRKNTISASKIETKVIK